ncbi:MAG: DUF4097 family beta strand repeat protein [Clostridiaceae bacterium]|nr:DUF4097 family beta strand repeat protein [Clostridiaceae bacterium]
MKRVGTLSSAIGLIFFGIWMILNQNNTTLAMSLFKCWPIIFIIIGIEILFYFNSKEDNRRVGFNPLIIFVVLLFMFSNIFNGVKEGFTGIFDVSMPSNWNNIFDKRYEKININKTIVFKGDKLNFELDNGSVEIKKSVDSNIKIEGNISVKKGVLEYSINEEVSGSECNISMDNNNIKLADIVIYVPNKFQIKITANNLKFDSNDGDFKADYILNIDNGSVKINGDAENMDIKMNNGIINVNNKLSKNVNLNMNNGKIDLRTEDKNVEIKADIDMGVSSVNGSNIVNAGIKRTYGSGEDKISVEVDHGTVNIESQE